MLAMSDCPCSHPAGWHWQVLPAGDSGAQQVVDPLQLCVWQYQAVDLLVAMGTRHHDPSHQHRVALPLLSGLKGKEQEQQAGETGETVLVCLRRWCMPHLHKKCGGKGGEV